MEDLLKDLLEVIGIIGAIPFLREFIRDYLPCARNHPIPQPGYFSLKYRASPRQQAGILAS